MRVQINWCLGYVLLVACAGDEPASPGAKESSGARAAEHALSWAPIAASEKYAGRTLEEWAVEWRRWSFSATSCESTIFDDDGSMCHLFQDPESPVFFLDYATTKVTRTRCRVPSGKALVTSLVMFSTDNIDVDPPRSAEELERRTSEALDSMRGLILEADHAAVENLEEWMVEPQRFTYYVPPAPNWFSCNGFDGVADTVIDPAYVSGYFVVFPAPEPGEHELRYGGVETVGDDNYSFDVTTRFVVDDSEHE